MLTLVEFEWGITCTGIFRIIVSKFGYWEKFHLIILFIVDESSKVDLYSTFLLFCLAIGLQIEDCWKLLLDSKEIT